jgi:ribosomal protein S25
VYPSWDTVNAGKGACRYCAKYGINYNVPSYIYLITHKQLNAHKVGFGNHKKREDRLQRFNKKGWKTYKVWQMDSGGQAVDIEKEIFRIIRKELKIPSYLTKADMPQTGGQAETMGADAITLLELEKIIKKVIKGYRQ